MYYGVMSQGYIPACSSVREELCHELGYRADGLSYPLICNPNEVQWLFTVGLKNVNGEGKTRVDQARKPPQTTRLTDIINQLFSLSLFFFKFTLCIRYIKPQLEPEAKFKTQ